MNNIYYFIIGSMVFLHYIPVSIMLNIHNDLLVFSLYAGSTMIAGIFIIFSSPFFNTKTIIPQEMKRDV